MARARGIVFVCTLASLALLYSNYRMFGPAAAAPTAAAPRVTSTRAHSAAAALTTVVPRVTKAALTAAAPRVTNRAHSPAAPLISMQQAVAAGALSDPPGLHVGYGPTRTWNGVRYIKSLVAHKRSDSRALPREKAGLLITPNYWQMRPGESDWRAWRLAPYQRIGRRWGMRSLSTKTALHATLAAHYAPAACPFLPETHVWSELVRTAGWERRVASRPTWILKVRP